MSGLEREKLSFEIIPTHLENVTGNERNMRFPTKMRTQDHTEESVSVCDLIDLIILYYFLNLNNYLPF